MKPLGVLALTLLLAGPVHAQGWQQGDLMFMPHTDPTIEIEAEKLPWYDIDVLAIVLDYLHVETNVESAIEEPGKVYNVPEPLSIGIFGVGLLGLIAARKRHATRT